MEQNTGKQRCQRIGCDVFFSDDDNPEDSCTYHASGPVFHDGMKEWSCCKKRSHDFTLFLAIPGCKTGKHTIEKPVLKKPAATRSSGNSVSAPSTDASSKEVCSRCRQGFFCSDHGRQSKPSGAVSSSPVECNAKDMGTAPVKVKKVVGINEPQVCKNKGCGKTFKEIENHDTACDHHPGPAIFHDRVRGWKCCDVHVKEFDEFMSIPPCTKGWHNADPVS